MEHASDFVPPHATEGIVTSIDAQNGLMGLLVDDGTEGQFSDLAGETVTVDIRRAKTYEEIGVGDSVTVFLDVWDKNPYKAWEIEKGSGH